MVTSSKMRTKQRPLMLSSGERLVSRSLSLEIDAAWMIPAATQPSHTFQSFVRRSLAGLCGKTYREYSRSIAVETSGSSFVGLQNSGIWVRGEFSTFQLSEFPNGVGGCLLSDIAEPVNQDSPFWLTPYQLGRLAQRLKKYRAQPWPELTAMVMDGPETKRRKGNAKHARRSGRPKGEKEPGLFKVDDSES